MKLKKWSENFVIVWITTKVTPTLQILKGYKNKIFVVELIFVRCTFK